VNGGETQAGAFPGLLGGEKWIERVLPGVTTHSDAVVADGKHHIATRNHGRVLAGVGLIQLDVPCLDADRSTAWHSVARVDHEVHQDLLDLPGVGDDIAARQSADCVHRLRLPELLLEISALREVDRYADEPEHRTMLIAHRRRSEQSRESLARFALHQELARPAFSDRAALENLAGVLAQ